MRNNSRRTFRRSPWLFVAAIVGVLLPLFQSAGFGQRRAAGTTAPKHYVEGELLVKFADDAALRASGRRHSQIGARAVRSFDALGWQQVRLPKGMSVAEGAARYRKLAGVLVAQPNFIYRVAAVPNDPRYGELYGMAKIQAPAAWDQTTGSRAIVVAVIDTGVRYAHEDLAANVWTNPFETPGNGVDDDQNGYVDDVHGADTYDRDGDPLDPHGHGTHVAGTIGAVGHNALGVAGVNWQVSLMVVKIYDATGFGTSASAIGAFEYVAWMRARGINVRVTNNSWGGPPEAAGFDQALKDAIDNCGALGILNVFAAGNDNRDTDAVPFYPASYDSPSILSVAASDQNDNRASFSNYGAASVDLTAPGVGILSTVRTASLYGYSSGTSMASPHVAGAAALLLSRNGALSVAALKAALLNSVDVLPQWASLSATGGRLNVARAAQNITACSFTLDPAGQAFTADGGSGVFNVNTAAGCDWTAASGAPAGWLTVTNGQSGSGAGTVTFTVAPNDTGSARAGALFVAGQVFNVTQAAPPPAPPVPPGSILISEFRIDGPNGPSDEFVEVYHRGDQPLNVATTDGSAGWSIVAGQSFDSNPNALTVLCTVPNGTRLPARGHFLCANVYTDSGGTYRGYSLADYGGTNAAAADTTWHSPGIAADGHAVRFAGLALVATSNP
ncbi:MAG: S8 family serine peptidase, partial [Pyrinomonadaceae bacterium]